MLPVSIVILTKNEEQDLPGCLDAVKEVSDDILVLDSFSTDQTLEIARSRGVPTFTHEFTGFGDQRNWAIDNLPHKYHWVLHIDADERLTPALVNEIKQTIDSHPVESGFFVPSKLMLRDHWLRYSAAYPVYQVRLFHRERLRFENSGHGQREVTDGKLGKLTEPYLHYAFTKGLLPWFEKHARYAAAESRDLQVGHGFFLSDLKAVAFEKGVQRRRAMKRLSYRFPFRGPLRFFYMLIIMRGFMDGWAGVTYARMMAIYESMIEVFIDDARPDSIKNEDSRVS